jgi:hypothetical protein
MRYSKLYYRSVGVFTEIVTMEYVELTDIYIFDSFGIEKIRIDGKYDISGLTKILIDEWVTYIECMADCGRSDYCKYFLAAKSDKSPSPEIQCGVLIDIIKNLIEIQYSKFTIMSMADIQNFLNALFHICKYINLSEQYTGYFIDKEILRYFGNSAPFLVQGMVKLRTTLDQIGSYLDKIPEFKFKDSILLVEGESEATFIRELKKTHFIWFLDLNCDSYNGKDNKRLRRIEMLLQRFKGQGYTAYLQGDADGKSKEIFTNLITKDLVKQSNTFVFSYDFETSIPDDLFIDILHDIGILKNISMEQYLAKSKETGYFENNMSAIKFVQRAFGYDLGKHKKEIARILAKKLDINSGWWQNEKFMISELGTFLRFITTMG